MNRVYRRSFILPVSMDNPAPPPQLELYAPPEGLKRVPTGWVLLAVLFLLLIVRQLVPGDETADMAKRSYTQQELEVKVAMRQKRLMDWLKAQKVPGRPTQESISQDTIDKLDKARKDDPAAARLYVGAKFERGDPISKADLDLVRRTKTLEDQIYTEIYSRSSLTERQADALSLELPDTEFAYRLAKVHAHDKAKDAGARNEMAPPWRGIALVVIACAGLAMLFLGVVGWIAYFTLRASGRLEPRGHPAEPMTKAGADRFAFRAVLLLAGFFLAAVVSQTLGHSAPKALQMLIELVVMFGIVVLMHRLPVLGVDIPLSRVGVSTKNLGRNILYGVAGYLMTLPLLAVALAVGLLLMKVFGPSSHPASEIIMSSPDR
ncbi:MAG: protease family protein, partial [Fimbriimonadaceae bacterium]|nr:protease family protein [Fimbriimonadaceae bacterium]